VTLATKNQSSNKQQIVQVCCNKAYEIWSDEEAKLKVHVKGNHGISDIINDDMVQLCINVDYV
jgi:predicted small metal-binding protein